MLKKLILSTFLTFYFTLNLFGEKIDESQCFNKGENFIFAAGECIEYRAYRAESNETITIIIHGTWDAGTNTLGRYAPFAEVMNLNTDLTTIAVALPGYSGSSTNNFEALAHKGEKNLAATSNYINFLGDLIEALKDRFRARNVNYIGHSAGAMMGATLTGIRPGLIQNIALAGGRYDIHETNKTKGLISMIDILDKIDKNTKFLFIYGTEDRISKPEVTTSFFEIVKNKGFDAKLIKVESAPHLDLDMTDTSVESITDFLGE